MKRFAIVVPITLAAIFLMLFSSFNSVKEAVLIILNIPFAMIGGICALVVGHFNLSVRAGVGVARFDELPAAGSTVKVVFHSSHQADCEFGAKL